MSIQKSDRPCVPFEKIVGTGNDFIFLDGREPALQAMALTDRPSFVKRVADRHLGVGADGVVFVEFQNETLVRWDFYNSDGSSAEMCGNAARCMGRWAESHLRLSEVRFQTLAGQVQARVEGRRVTVQLDFLKAQAQPIREPAASLLNTGVPHAVYVPANGWRSPNEHIEAVRQLRFAPEAGARGANVTLLEIKKNSSSDLRVRTVTFERGVEDWTLSCGTGVIAAAISALRAVAGGSAELETPGGTLFVQILQARDGVVTSVALSGPAEIVCRGEFSFEELGR